MLKTLKYFSIVTGCQDQYNYLLLLDMCYLNTLVKCFIDLNKYNFLSRIWLNNQQVLSLVREKHGHLEWPEAKMNFAKHLRHLEKTYMCQTISPLSWSNMFAAFMVSKMLLMSTMPVTGCSNLERLPRNHYHPTQTVYNSTFWEWTLRATYASILPFLL